MTTQMTITIEKRSTEEGVIATAKFKGNFYDLSLSEKLNIARQVSEKYGSGFRYIGADDSFGVTILLYLKG